MNNQDSVNDPVRREITDMYEDALDDEAELYDGEPTEDQERSMRVNAMVDVALRVRKDLDPLLANKLKKLENLKDYKQYLLSEFRIFGFIPKANAAKIFAEYLLLSVLNEFEVDDHIDFDVFGNDMNMAFAQTTDDYKDLRRIFPWGRLID